MLALTCCVLEMIHLRRTVDETRDPKDSNRVGWGRGCNRSDYMKKCREVGRERGERGGGRW
jgi:hypothetical protein